MGFKRFHGRQHPEIRKDSQGKELEFLYSNMTTEGYANLNIEGKRVGTHAIGTNWRMYKNLVPVFVPINTPR